MVFVKCCAHDIKLLSVTIYYSVAEVHQVYVVGVSIPTVY